MLYLNTNDDLLEDDYDLTLLNDSLSPAEAGEKVEKEKNLFQKLVHALGYRFIVFLFVSQFMGKGMLYTGLRRTMLPFFKNMPNNINAFDLQMYTVLVSMPWVVKPLFGLCSDFVTLFGFAKRGYLIIASCIGIASSIVLLILSFYQTIPPLYIALCMMGVSVQISVYDLLSEGKYSEIRNEHPHLGSNITNMVQAFISIGSVISMLYVGYISDAKIFYIIFTINLVLSSTLIIPTMLGFLPEYRLVNSKWIQLVSRERIYKERHFIMVIAYMGMGGIVCTLVSTLASPVVGLCMSGTLLLTSMLGAYLVFPPLITRIALYQVVTSMSTPSLGSALGLVGTGITVVGTVVYQLLFSKMRFRPVLLVTTVLVVLGGVGDLVLVRRWNLVLHIPDKVAYIMGEAIFEPLVDTMNWIPVSALITIAVVKGSESSCFAFMAGISNFARMFSELSGGLIFKYAGITTTPNTACNFDVLWQLVILCSIILPMTINIPAIFIVPNMEQTDTLN